MGTRIATVIIWTIMGGIFLWSVINFYGEFLAILAVVVIGFALKAALEWGRPRIPNLDNRITATLVIAALIGAVVAFFVIVPTSALIECMILIAVLCWGYGVGRSHGQNGRDSLWGLLISILLIVMAFFSFYFTEYKHDPYRLFYE